MVCFRQCSFLSVWTPHTEHVYSTCINAPSKVSTNEPRNPRTPIINRTCKGKSNNKAANKAINAAPAAEAAVPRKDIAPDVPGAHFLRVVILTGFPLLKTPSSEAQV